MRIWILTLIIALASGPSLLSGDTAFVASPQYLGTLGRAPSMATAINNLGEVVGFSLREPEDDFWRAFFWSAETGMIDLGTLGGRTSEAVDINDLGQVVGWSETAGGQFHAFLWTRHAGMRDIGAFSAAAINNRGEIAGARDGRPVIRTPDGRFVSLGNVSGAALDINDKSEVVGWLPSVTPPARRQPFFWSRAASVVMIEVPTNDARNVVAARINNTSEVAGYTYPGLDFQSHVFTWSRLRGTVMLGDYRGGFIDGFNGNVFGLNSLGQLVATSTSPADEATRNLLWAGGAGPLIFGSDMINYARLAVNEVGEIAGADHPGPGPEVAAVWRIRLTRSERLASLRSLVNGLVLRSALAPRDARSLTLKLRENDDRLRAFVNHARALGRSGRLDRSGVRALERAAALTR